MVGAERASRHGKQRARERHRLTGVVCSDECFEFRSQDRLRKTVPFAPMSEIAAANNLMKCSGRVKIRRALQQPHPCATNRRSPRKSRDDARGRWRGGARTAR